METEISVPHFQEPVSGSCLSHMNSLHIVTYCVVTSMLIQCVQLYITTQLPLSACRQELCIVAKRYQQLPLKLFRNQCSCVLRRVKYWLLLCVSIRFNILFQQLAFLFKSCVTCGSVRKCREKFRKFPGITVPSPTGIHELKKVRSAGLFLVKKFLLKRRPLNEENNLEEWGYVRTHTTDV
jgi:hypothetical protein